MLYSFAEQLSTIESNRFVTDSIYTQYTRVDYKKQ